ncbi:MAG: argininosuccinate lyase [bacterium]|nr:argininosuccinate lyase [bacterium]
MSEDSTRLWDKGGTVDEVVHRFTVGDDPVWDLQLVHWDCLGSAAHARTLARIELLTTAELEAILRSLAEIDQLACAKRFEIPAELEDGHTALEAELVRRCGDAGARIHAGRSRNDQVAVALRLFMRYHVLIWMDLLDGFLKSLLERAKRHGDTPMPGYTHLRPAMPSSLGLWLHAVAEAVLEQMQAGLELLNRLDACPLGTGAGFGVPLPLDRAYTAGLLGFSRIQRSPLDVQNSRGRLEKYFMRLAVDVADILEKLSSDLILFSTPEFGFFELPPAMTTGSSIMPQKRNPDVLELLRGRSAQMRARHMEVENVRAKLPSGYQRDLQLTKEPVVRTAQDLADMLHVATRVVQELVLNPARMTAAMKPDLYATHAALAMASEGVPFRVAYRRIAAEIEAGELDEQRVQPWRDGSGRVSPEVWAELDHEAGVLSELTEQAQAKITAAEDKLFATSP